jgi:hypothetical protein
MKREIPILLTVLCGLTIIWSFFSNYPKADAANTELLQWALIFFSVAFILGITNLIRVSLKQIAAKHNDSAYKIILLVVMFAYLFIGLAEQHEWFGPGSLFGGPGDMTVKDWVYRKMFIPLQATMFSLLAFFIASAAFRAFRARSMESTLLLLAGAIVMLGQVPLGEQITGGLAPRWLAFLMVYINAAGQKAIIIGATLGVLATGLRIVLGIERSYLSE